MNKVTTKYLLVWRYKGQDQRVHQREFQDKKTAEAWLEDLKISSKPLSEWCLRKHETSITETMLEWSSENTKECSMCRGWGKMADPQKIVPNIPCRKCKGKGVIPVNF